MQNFYIEPVLKAINIAYLMHSNSIAFHPEIETGIKNFGIRFGKYLNWKLSQGSGENNSERWFRKEMNILLKNLWFACHQEDSDNEIKAIFRTIVENIDYCGHYFDNPILGKDYGMYDQIVNDKCEILNFIDFPASGDADDSDGNEDDNEEEDPSKMNTIENLLNVAEKNLKMAQKLLETTREILKGNS